MIHHVFANRSNIGDWLSARGIQSLLAPLEITEHLCDEPFVQGTLVRLAAAHPKDLIVIGGGGLFLDYFAPFWEGFSEIAERVPFGIWGVGYCDLKLEPSHPPASLIQNIVRQSSLCLVRDDLTRNYLQPYALPAPVSCPSLLEIEPPPSRRYGVLHVNNYTTAGAEAYDAMRACGEEFAGRTGRVYQETNNRVQPGSERELAATLRLYAASDIVLSSALHGCIIALAMGLKVLAVSGDHKIEAFMRVAGLGDWVCDINEVDSFPQHLEALSTQKSASNFVSSVQQRNLAFAEQVGSLARMIQT